MEVTTENGSNPGEVALSRPIVPESSVSIYSGRIGRKLPDERRNSMALGLTPEHLELAAAVRGWSQRHCPADAVRAAADGEDSGAARYRAELAPSLAGQGLLGLHLPEDAGGQGYGLPELAVALEETGRALLPGAFLPTVLASAVLAEMETGQPPSVGGP